MAEMNERDAKLVQYLSEAYGKERELETALEAHIAATAKAPYKKRLKQHLKETKGHSKQLQRRIKQLGGGTQPAKAPGKAKGLARAGGEQEKMLKNARAQYFNEHEEIAAYLAIEAFAAKVGDAETAKLARSIRREEERMAKFLEAQIKSLSGAVAVAEVPAKQRRAAAPARRRSARKAGGAKKAATKAKASRRPKAAGRAKKAPSRAKSAK